DGRTRPGVSLISRCDQYPFRAGPTDWSGSLSVAYTASRSRRSSSRRKRIVAKSSAARGRFIFPPIPLGRILVALWWHTDPGAIGSYGGQFPKESLGPGRHPP